VTRDVLVSRPIRRCKLTTLASATACRALWRERLHQASGRSWGFGPDTVIDWWPPSGAE